jgi:pyruvyl transferase EpsO
MLAPDMAHQLWPTLRGEVMKIAKGEQKGPLFFMRVDVEQADGYPAIDAYSQRFIDWHDVVTRRLRVIKRLFMKGASVQTGMNAAVVPDEFYFSLIRNEIIRIAAKLVDYNPWVTSRLHGAILGLLMDKPVVALDNSYGKLSSYLNTWGEWINPVAVVNSPAQARQVADFARAADAAPDKVSWADYSTLAAGAHG